MTELTRPTVPKWPFFVGDAFMLGLAWFVYQQSKLPLDNFALGAVCVCVALGALMAIMPFVLDYRITLQAAETDGLSTVVEKVRNLEGIANQISLATGQWQTANEHSTRAVAAATDIGVKMAAEAKSFAQSMQKANDAEKSTLRLEVEKLRRTETDWVQVAVRMLDHTFALHSAAVRSGKTGLVEQLTQFQNAVRDAARRVGLVPVIAEAGDSFDPAIHKTQEGEETAADSVIGATLATGYTLRGQLVRPVLVSLSAREENGATADDAQAHSAAAASAAPQEQTLL